MEQKKGSGPLREIIDKQVQKHLKEVDRKIHSAERVAKEGMKGVSEGNVGMWEARDYTSRKTILQMGHILDEKRDREQAKAMNGPVKEWKPKARK